MCVGGLGGGVWIFCFSWQQPIRHRDGDLILDSPRQTPQASDTEEKQSLSERFDEILRTMEDFAEQLVQRMGNENFYYSQILVPKGDGTMDTIRVSVRP